MYTKQTIKFSLILLLVISSPMAIAEQVGTIQYTRGAVTMQNMDGSSARLVGKNSEVGRGEVIKTGPKSFSIVKLKDGTRMTIRPNSSFAVEEMNAKKDSTASAILRLFRGGLRAITGYISKKNPKGYKLRTSVATIGIRGTEFDTRLCQEDCADENNRLKNKQNKQLEKTVARVVFVRGSAQAESINGENRTLKAGSSVFEGDTLNTGKQAYAIIVFRDKSRVSLQANTVFRVDEMKFEEKSEEKSSGLFSLLRGGLRTITGLLGKLHPKKYQMRTSVATIGIRGTGYDLMCSGSCVASNTPASTPASTSPQSEGLYAHVWDGSIDFGGQLLPTGAAGFKANRSTTPVVLPQVPSFFKTNPVPRPDSIDVDEKTLFSKVKAEDAPPGLYVSVTKGHVTVEGKTGSTVELKAGQSAFTDVLGRKISKLPATPMFQKFDVYPLPNVKNPGSVNLKASRLGDDAGRVCEIK